MDPLMSYPLNIWGKINGSSVDYYVDSNGKIYSDESCSKEEPDSVITVDVAKRLITIITTAQSSDNFEIDDSDGSPTTEYTVQVGSGGTVTYEYDATGNKFTSSANLPATFEPDSSGTYIYNAGGIASIEITGLTKDIAEKLTISGKKIMVSEEAVAAIGDNELKITTSGYTFEFANGYTPEKYNGNTWVNSGSGVYTLYQDGGSSGAVLSTDKRTLSMGTATALATITITGTADLSGIKTEGSDIKLNGTTIVSVSGTTVKIAADISSQLTNGETMKLVFADNPDESDKYLLSTGDITVASEIPTSTKTLSGSNGNYIYTISDVSAYNTYDSSTNTFESHGAVAQQTLNFTITGLADSLLFNNSNLYASSDTNYQTSLGTITVDDNSKSIIIKLTVAAAFPAEANRTNVVATVPDGYSVSWDIDSSGLKGTSSESAKLVDGDDDGGFTYTSASQGKDYTAQGNVLAYNANTVDPKTFTITGLKEGDYSLDGDNILLDGVIVGNITLIGEKFTVTLTDNSVFKNSPSDGNKIELTSESAINFELVVSAANLSYKFKDPVESSFVGNKYTQGYKPAGYIKTSDKSGELTYTYQPTAEKHAEFTVTGIDGLKLENITDYFTIGENASVTLKKTALEGLTSGSNFTFTKDNPDTTFAIEGTAGEDYKTEAFQSSGTTDFTYSTNEFTFATPNYQKWYSKTTSGDTTTITPHDAIASKTITLTIKGDNNTFNTAYPNAAYFSAEVKNDTITLKYDNTEIGKAKANHDANSYEISGYTFTLTKDFLDHLGQDGSIKLAGEGTNTFSLTETNTPDADSKEGEAKFEKDGDNYVYTAKVAKADEFTVNGTTISHSKQEGGEQFTLSGSALTAESYTVTNEGVIQITQSGGEPPPVLSQR